MVNGHFIMTTWLTVFRKLAIHLWKVDQQLLKSSKTGLLSKKLDLNVKLVDVANNERLSGIESPQTCKTVNSAVYLNQGSSQRISEHAVRSHILSGYGNWSPIRTTLMSAVNKIKCPKISMIGNKLWGIMFSITPCWSRWMSKNLAETSLDEKCIGTNRQAGRGNAMVWEGNQQGPLIRIH